MVMEEVSWVADYVSTAWATGELIAVRSTEYLGGLAKRRSKCALSCCTGASIQVVLPIYACMQVVLPVLVPQCDGIQALRE